ncbi:Na+/H+ antiporter subunit C [Vreelandella malpeensis]|uniref:Na+/H+ antiporter subunit C n=1 Tax=Vreelandella malpeensis TaxID=1172368 RepID=A0ABS8DTI6_9GAMM|nr:Na+/H+ antiporter subunit C [Halomonas malpeensis]MCB8889637.1 Na+/H+ antiporter subunit C [Halomonas malpeensis]
METLYAVTTGVLSACGLYLTLRGRTFSVVVGLTLLSYAVNLFLFSMGGLTTDGAAVIHDDGHGAYADPLPQALVLTAIVIGFAMTAFVVILAMRARSELGNDQVDGKKEDRE